MPLVFDANAPKKATNLSINSDLLSQAKNLHINISSVLENALAEKVKQEKRKAWLEENGEAIAIYNKTVSETGTLGDTLRTF